MVPALRGARHRGGVPCSPALAPGGGWAENAETSGALAPLPPDSMGPLWALRAGCIRRGVRPPSVHRILVPGPLRRLAGTAWPGVLRSRYLAIRFLSYRSAAGGAHRAREHHGLHPPALQRPAGGHPLRTQPELGARLAPRPLRALPDGRSRPAVL